jgi:hypothetical protein
LQGVDEPKKGSGLEFMYINVKDEYRDGKVFDVNYSVAFSVLTFISAKSVLWIVLCHPLLFDVFQQIVEQVYFRC